MSRGGANVLLAAGIAIACFVANFLVFTVNYNRLATPYLLEEQRVDNAAYIMTATLSSFGLVAAIIGIAVFLMLQRRTRAGGA